jgi:hypothetical protein
VDNDKIKYLEMIEGIISRLASHSFSIKNWFVISLGGLLLFCLNHSGNKSLGVAFVVTIAFYLIDAYYLFLERCFRKKYNQALSGECDLFDLDIRAIKNEISMWSAMKSLSLLLYFVTFILLFLLGIIANYTELKTSLCSNICTI